MLELVDWWLSCNYDFAAGQEKEFGDGNVAVPGTRQLAGPSSGSWAKAKVVAHRQSERRSRERVG